MVTLSNRQEKALRATAFYTAFGYISQILNLVAIPVYLISLGAEDYGLILIALTFMGYLALAELGAGAGTAILISHAYGEGDRVRMGSIVKSGMLISWLSCSVVLLAIGATWFFALNGMRLPIFKNNAITDSLVLIVGINICVNLQIGILYNFALGVQEAHISALFQGAGRVISVLTMMLSAWVSGDIILVMLTQFIVNLLSSVLFMLYMRRRHCVVLKSGEWFCRDLILTQVKTGVKSFVLQVGRTLTHTAPVIGLSVSAGAAAIPLYTITMALLQFALMPIHAWNISLQAAYGEAWVSGNRIWVIDNARQTFERGLVWLSCCVTGFLIIGDSFVNVWTNKVLNLSLSFSLAIVGIATVHWFQVTGQHLLAGLNRQRVLAIAELCGGVMAVFGSSYIIRYFGVDGVGLVVVGVACVTAVPLIVVEVRRHVGAGALPSVPTLLLCILLPCVIVSSGCVVLNIFIFKSNLMALAAAFIVAVVCVIIQLVVINLARRDIVGSLMDMMVSVLRLKRLFV